MRVISYGTILQVGAMQGAVDQHNYMCICDLLYANMYVYLCMSVYICVYMYLSVFTCAR